MISIAGLNRADVLAVLYNAAKPQGLGFLHYDPTPMERAEAEALISEYTYFDYLKGRVMKIDLSGDEIDATWFDHDNGAGTAALAIKNLRERGEVNPDAVKAVHSANTNDAAKLVRGKLGEPSRTEVGDGFAVFHLGLSDVAGALTPALDKVLGDKGKAD